MHNNSNNICALCGRMLAEPYDRHHVIPRSKGGREIVELHRICHSKIHSVFSIKQLNSEFGSIDDLKEYDEIRKFIKWLDGKPPQFYKRTKWKLPFRAYKCRLLPVIRLLFPAWQIIFMHDFILIWNGCARSSAGQSNGLLIRRSEVRILSGAKKKSMVGVAQPG